MNNPLKSQIVANRERFEKEEGKIEKLEKAIIFMAENLTTYGGGFVDKQVKEILYPPNPSKFLECDTCRSKSGSPELCKGCLHNRALIEKLS